MCAIVGALLLSDDSNALGILNHIWTASQERGRDGQGYALRTLGAVEQVRKTVQRNDRFPITMPRFKEAVVIGNVRAEPTTEFVHCKKLDDQQPYSYKGWSIVHNGTIANDAELRNNELDTRIDSAALVELLGSGAGHKPEDFFAAVDRVQGSFAFLATHAMRPNVIYIAANYRPIWYIETPYGVFFASSRSYFPSGYTPVMWKPYRAAVVTASDDGKLVILRSHSLYSYPAGHKALVVCSGGMDSVVAATYAQKTLGFDITLIHFQYGSRAQTPERVAVASVAQALDVPLVIMPLPVYSKEDSPLLQSDSKLAGGEAGAEFAHEWVPARNLLLLAVATAYAEAHGMDTLVLGNNLEEAGAYPDNEPEFINKYNDMLPFAVGDGVRMQVIMPVGNLMKHEIVALGHTLQAPLHLTWSCYRAGEKHCGKCGPCFMRRTAFDINDFAEVIEYEN